MSQDRLSSTFAALADPTRRAILARLANGETSVTELAGPFAMSLPAISKHLKVLERAGLIARGREAQWRPCRLQAGPMQDVSGWLDQYRQFWEQSFDRLDDYLDTLQAKAKASKRAGGKSPTAGAAAGSIKASSNPPKPSSKSDRSKTSSKPPKPMTRTK